MKSVTFITVILIMIHKINNNERYSVFKEDLSKRKSPHVGESKECYS